MSRGLRIARIVILSVVALELLYIIVGNIALRAGLFQRLANTDTEALRISFEPGWTVIPGRVHIRNFQLRQQDNNVEQQLSVDEATLQVRLLPLLRKRFHATSVEARGTRYRLRHKVILAAIEGLRARLAAYPPIEGYHDPPLKWGRKPDSDPADLWKVRLDDVDAQVHEIWVQELRYVGFAHIVGGFLLQTGERVQVGPVEVDVAPGTLSLGQTRTIMTSLRGQFRCQVDDFDTNIEGGLDVFKFISTNGWLRGDVTGLGFTDAYFDPDLLFHEGAGWFEAVWGLDHGQFLFGSRIAYATDRARLTTPPLEFRGPIRAEVAVEPGTRRPVGGARLRSPRIAIDGTGRRSAAQAAVASDPEIHLVSTSVKVGEPWDLARARLELPSLSAPDLRLLNGFIRGAEVTIKQGAATAKARAALDANGHLTGNFEVGLKQAEVAVADRATVTATGTLSGRIDRPRGRGGQIEDIDILLQPLVVTGPKAASGDGWLRLEVGTVELSPLSVRGDARLFLPEGAPFLLAAGIDEGSIKKLPSTQELLMRARFLHHQGASDLQLLDARVRGASAEGRWRRERAISAGAFLVRTGLINVGITLRNGQSKVKLFAGSGWLAEQLRALGLRPRS